MSINIDDLMRSIYDSTRRVIYSNSTCNDDGKSFFTMSRVGVGVSSQIVESTASSLIDLYADDCPAVSTVYVPTGNSIKYMYEKIITCAEGVMGPLQKQFEFANRKYSQYNEDNIKIVPQNWFKELEYISVVVDTEALFKDENSVWEDISGSDNLNIGFIGVKDKVEDDFEYYKLHQDTKSMKFMYEVAVIDLRRPWFFGPIISNNNWKLKGVAVSDFSNGLLDNSNTGIFPLYPSHVVVLRNLKVKATWAKEDRSLIETKLNGSTEVKVGPFKVKGTITTDSKTETFTSSYDGVTLETSPDKFFLQGFLCKLNPMFPVNQ